MSSVILRAAARPLAVLLLLFSLHMLLRGHNEPGGGFIGGLLGATGLVIHALACGTAATREALRVSPEAIAAMGLGLALLAGLLGAWAVMTFVMDADFEIVWPNALAVILGGTLATLVTGLLFALRPLAVRPARVLRARE